MRYRGYKTSHDILLPLSVTVSFVVFLTGKVWNAWQLTFNKYGRNEIYAEYFFLVYLRDKQVPKLMYKSRWGKKWKLVSILKKWYLNKCIFTLKRNSLKQTPLPIFSDHRIFLLVFYGSEITGFNKMRKHCDPSINMEQRKRKLIFRRLKCYNSYLLHCNLIWLRLS